MPQAFADPIRNARAFWAEAGLAVYALTALGVAACVVFAWHGFDPRVMAADGAPLLIEKNGTKIVAAPVYDLTIPLTGAAAAGFTAALLVAGMLLPHVRRAGPWRSAPLIAAVCASALGLVSLAAS
jgi:hypothetical protein